MSPLNAAPAHARLRVLVVDDMEEVLRSLARFLEAFGYDVVCASNGEQALTCFTQTPFDIVLSDIKMPRLDGLQLLREIRHLDKRVPLILMTGEPAVSTAVQALELGAYHYLTKPVDIASLETALQKAGRFRQQRIDEAENRICQPQVAEPSTAPCIDDFEFAYQPILVTGDSSFDYESFVQLRNHARYPVASNAHAGPQSRIPWEMLNDDPTRRLVRDKAVTSFLQTAVDGNLFLSLTPLDLKGASLYQSESALSAHATRIILQVSDRYSLDNMSETHRRISTLKELGFKFAIDDVGGGQAGMALLMTLQPEFMKLSQSLTEAIAANPLKQRLVRSLIALAQDLEMQVGAKEVSSNADRDCLVDLGCHLLQGPLIGLPTSVVEGSTL